MAVTKHLVCVSFGIIENDVGHFAFVVPYLFHHRVHETFVWSQVQFGIAGKPRHEPGSDLAAALWKEDIREFKILASLLQPVDDFPFKQAEQWVKEIPYLEIAEQCSRNLFCKLPYVDNLLLGLIFNVEDEYARTVAYLIWMELFRVGKTVVAPVRAAFIVECMRTIAWPES